MSMSRRLLRWCLGFRCHSSMGHGSSPRHARCCASERQLQPPCRLRVSDGMLDQLGFDDRDDVPTRRRANGERSATRRVRKVFGIEWHVVAQDVITSTRQLVCDRSVISAPAAQDWIELLETIGQRIEGGISSSLLFDRVPKVPVLVLRDFDPWHESELRMPFQPGLDARGTKILRTSW